MPTVRLFIKSVVDFPSGLDEMVDNLKTLLSDEANIDVDEDANTRQRLDLTDLEVIARGSCDDNDTTADQDALQSNRDDAGVNDVVVYIVRGMTPAADGCAAFSDPDFPAAVIVEDADPWVLAHEMGHVLGLEHVGNSRRLMFTKPSLILDLPPDLITSEKTTMKHSRYAS